MEQLSMFIIMFSALLIPILMARFKVASVPTAVAEIIVGIILGKSGLNLVVQTRDLTFLSSLGVIVLMFLSGMEINFSLFKKQPGVKRDHQSPVNLAIESFAGIMLTAFVLAMILKMTGMFSDVLLATIIFSTVALGVVIATLKEKEILSRPMGQTILLTAVLGEVIPMLSLTVYASINGGNAERLWMIVLLFLAAIVLLNRFKQPFIWFNKVTKATTQLDIRLAFFLIFTLVTLAETVGAENILGAFLAGMVMKLLEPSETTQDKLTSIGYGFFIPIFFLMTGVKLNLRTLLVNPHALALIPVLVICFVLAKLTPMLVFRQRFNGRNAFAGGFLLVTTITLVLPTLQVARNLHAITSTQSDAFVLAAVIVCIIAPIVFNSVYRLVPEDKVKQRVVFLGTNVFSVPVAQQLSRNWYEVRMVTDSKDNYKTYDSEVKNLTYLPELNEAALEKEKLFDCDIMAIDYLDDAKNFRLAKLAKAHHVSRVIAGQNQRNLDEDQRNKLQKLGVEIFNVYNVQTSVLRALIESPSIMTMLNSTEAGLYEVVVRNRRYTGQQLQALPFIDKITVSRIRRGSQWLIPRGTTVIEPGDHLIFTGKASDVANIRAELRKRN
ncbi:cation:proton antiporter [uncultured Limosilactobacillus sp.]|uniref:monovalent cation:proton antiporter family protein n=1 Tax=uncultured Limosilactobacillus sp. TaxID=2837629 RepID=UPI0025D92F38|nr:cation:proton antiporter [uncultured Limosilactobacillus sp.]